MTTPSSARWTSSSWSGEWTAAVAGGLRRHRAADATRLMDVPRKAARHRLCGSGVGAAAWRGRRMHPRRPRPIWISGYPSGPVGHRSEAAATVAVAVAAAALAAAIGADVGAAAVVAAAAGEVVTAGVAVPRHG